MRAAVLSMMRTSPARRQMRGRQLRALVRSSVSYSRSVGGSRADAARLGCTCCRSARCPHRHRGKVIQAPAAAVTRVCTALENRMAVFTCTMGCDVKARVFESSWLTWEWFGSLQPPLAGALAALSRALSKLQLVTRFEFEDAQGTVGKRSTSTFRWCRQREPPEASEPSTVVLDHLARGFLVTWNFPTNG